MAPDAPSQARVRRGARWLALLGILFLASGVLLGTATPASADSVSDIEAKINKEWDSLEPTIEDYDAVHAKLVVQQQKATRLQKAIEPLKLEVTLALARAGSMSAQLYEQGPTGTAAIILDSDNAATALHVMASVEQVAKNQQSLVSGTVSLMAKFQNQEAPIDILVSSLNAQTQALAVKSTQIQTSINQLDALRVQAYGASYKATNIRPKACPQVYHGDAGSRAAAWACAQIGKRYVFGSDGPNTFDCSGLTMQAWAQEGVSLPHNAYQQKQSMPSVSYSNLRPGDLIFYFASVHHVAIYVGKGWMVNAPQTGVPVEMSKYNQDPIVGYGRP